MAVLLFDSQGTLVDFFSLADLIEPYVTGARIAQTITSSWRQRLRWVIFCSTAVGYKLSMPQVTEASLRWALEYHHIELSNSAVQDILSKSHQLRAFSDVPEALKLLKEHGHIIKIVANPTKIMLERQLEYGGILNYIDEIISNSDEEGVFKPHPKTYQLGLKRAGVPIGECLWVSSHLMELLGAYHHGIKTAWTNRRMHPLDQIGFVPTYNTMNLLQLAQKLGNHELIDQNSELYAKAIRWAVSEMGLLLAIDGNDCPGCDSSGRFCRGTRVDISTPDTIDSQILTKEIVSRLGYAYKQAVGSTRSRGFFLDLSGLPDLDEESVIKLLSVTGAALIKLGFIVDTNQSIRMAKKIMNDS